MASLHLRLGDPVRRATLARWLERQATALREDGEQYAPRFTAGYWERRECR